ncbi:hypothetical protein HY464_00935 [Candidatus Peregrinibacteria bacterium]|nr:hypothetical protein [Candidatus Peregrinibacteria bacterium]MBI2523879.1 hypothetical protein [Candidatus Peregrinibacteria bacterium]MBI4129238.1 hypothetical protein [Candidatus Peregrinibacteria bacterium]
MDSTLMSSILFGTLGGLVRGVVGITKYMEQNRKNKAIDLKYLLFALAVAGLVGGIAGALASNDRSFAFIAGYAGTDFLESLYKIRRMQGATI